MESNYPSMVMPSSIWPEGGQPINGSRQQYQQQPWQLDGLHPPVWGREEDNSNFITPENSLLSYDSSANSGKNQNFTRNHPSLCIVDLHNKI